MERRIFILNDDTKELLKKNGITEKDLLEIDKKIFEQIEKNKHNKK